MDTSDPVQEKLMLDRELREYIQENGFSYTEYCAPTPGGWYDNYRQRERKILDQILAKP